MDRAHGNDGVWMWEKVNARVLRGSLGNANLLRCWHCYLKSIVCRLRILFFSRVLMKTYVLKAVAMLLTVSHPFLILCRPIHQQRSRFPSFHTSPIESSTRSFIFRLPPLPPSPPPPPHLCQQPHMLFGNCIQRRQYFEQVQSRRASRHVSILERYWADLPAITRLLISLIREGNHNTAKILVLTYHVLEPRLTIWYL